jgi:hypothetical protein
MCVGLLKSFFYDCRSAACVHGPACPLRQAVSRAKRSKLAPGLIGISQGGLRLPRTNAAAGADAIALLPTP